VVAGKLYLLNEVCRARCEGVTPQRLVRLTTEDVRRRLVSYSAYEVWNEILGESDLAYASAARTMLADRLYQMKQNQEPTPELPHLRDLLAWKAQKQ
jgi:hypothetical protein